VSADVDIKTTDVALMAVQLKLKNNLILVSEAI